MADHCMVVDIETVPNEFSSTWKGKNERDFYPPIYHKIICIGYAEFDGEGVLTNIGVLGLNNESEERALETFNAMLTSDSLLVTWNGRRFDVPVISYRSMHYGMATPWDTNEFRTRYNKRGHIDVQDHVTGFRATEGVHLDELALAIGLPGKMGVNGCDVEELYARRKYREIATYCITDVVQTAILFFRYGLKMGWFTSKEYLESVRSFYPKTALAETYDAAVFHGIQQVVRNSDWKRLTLGEG